MSDDWGKPEVTGRRRNVANDPAADIHKNRAGAKSLTLNVDAPTQGAVN